MWFKQFQLFQLPNTLSHSTQIWAEKLEPLMFTSCLPSLPFSVGWVPPIEAEDEPLFRTAQQCTMMCMQVEEKILPATVVRQMLAEAVKQVETSENRKLSQKEKFALKDDIVATLLPRAFSRLSRVYAYIDAKNHWLVVATTNSNLTQKFMTLFKKSISDDVHPITIKNLSTLLTGWLKTQQYPTSFAIEKACVLQDARQENRVIRCQHQDLFAPPIQSLLKDNCEVTQLALSWHDQLQFVLLSDFSFRSLQYQDEVIAQSKESQPETMQQQFDVNFLIMSNLLGNLLGELLDIFRDKQPIPLAKTA